MPTTVVDGNRISEQILDLIMSKTEKMRAAGIEPKLAVILVGKNPAAESYVRIKQKKAAEVGIEVEIHKFDPNVSENELLSSLDSLNSDPSVSGIIVQLPLPGNLDREKILNSIDPRKDVDCLTEANKLKLINSKEPNFEPPAPAAVLQILDFYKIDLKAGRILIIGSGDLVGKPLSTLLLKRGINFELANKTTENLLELVGKSDVIITGVGKPKFITGSMVKEGVVVVDGGTSGSEEGEIAGDVDFESVAAKAKLITPVPGGVGPVTVAMLLRNVVRAAEAKSFTSPQPSPE